MEIHKIEKDGIFIRVQLDKIYFYEKCEIKPFYKELKKVIENWEFEMQRRHIDYLLSRIDELETENELLTNNKGE